MVRVELQMCEWLLLYFKAYVFNTSFALMSIFVANFSIWNGSCTVPSYNCGFHRIRDVLQRIIVEL